MYREYIKECCAKNWSVTEELLRLEWDCKIEIDCQMQGSRNKSEKKERKVKYRKYMKECCAQIWNVLEG